MKNNLKTMNNLTEKYPNNIFEKIKKIDENGNEYWYAREISKTLEYSDWRNFLKVLSKAKEACENSRINVDEQLVEVNKLSKRNNNATVNIQDYKLSRYICYLIVQNADPSKEVVALGQTYFAIQTRKQEVIEREYDSLTDDEKRIFQRRLTKQGNYTLQKVAITAGVKNMAEFHNAGYRGLYNGETADDIFRRKKLRYREDILDNMTEDELVANLFRINQTKQKLLKDKTQGEKEDKAYTYMLKILNGIGGTKLKYNWLITNIEAYPENNPKALKLIKENNYLFLSTKELMELLNENDFQWIWAVFSAIPECYNIEEIVKYNLPFADGNYGIHKDEPIIQHPLAEIEIDVEDSSSVTIVTKDNQIADLFKKIYPNAKEDWR